MKIIIHSQAKNKLSENEIKYLKLLELNNFLEIKIIKAKNQLKKINQTNNRKLALALASEIILKLKIYPQFTEAIADLILFDQIFNVLEPIQVFAADRQLNRKCLYNAKVKPKLSLGGQYQQQIQKAWYQDCKTIAENDGYSFALPIIQINKKIKNKTNLKKLIDQKWPEIKIAIEKFKKISPFPIELQQISIRDVEEFINFYLTKKNDPALTHEQIAKKTNIEHDSLRKKYSLGIKILKQLHFI